MHTFFNSSGLLDKIAINLSTDKSSLANNYTYLYEYYFKNIKEDSLHILELGIASEAKSLKLWSEYFPNAQIYGIDREIKCNCHNIDRVSIFIGDLMNETFMENTLNKIDKQFDIIIDDAGHTQPQIMYSLNQLWPHLKNNGIYIIEDLHTSYLSSFGMAYRQQGTAIEELKGLIDSLYVDTYKETSKSKVYKILGAFCKKEQLTQFEETLCSIHFYQGICFLFKV